MPAVCVLWTTCLLGVCVIAPILYRLHMDYGIPQAQVRPSSSAEYSSQWTYFQCCEAGSEDPETIVGCKRRGLRRFIAVAEAGAHR